MPDQNNGFSSPSQDGAGTRKKNYGNPRLTIFGCFSIGKLTKDLSHIAVTFSLPKNHKGQQIVQIEIHHGSRKNVATLRTVKSIIENLVTGVTRGYKYKMRYVYAHFPINVNIEKNAEGLDHVEIR